MKLEIISREPPVLKFDAPLLFVHGSCHAAWSWDENFLPFFAERDWQTVADFLINLLRRFKIQDLGFKI